MGEIGRVGKRGRGATDVEKGRVVSHVREGWREGGRKTGTAMVVSMVGSSRL